MENSIAAVKGIEKLSASELTALRQSADVIGIPTDWLATVISFETAGTFDPKIKNKAGSGATGLIQFMPTTAANLLGMAKDKAIATLEAMSFSQQLKVVEKYFSSYRGKLNSLEDVYLAVFYPAAMNKAATYVVGSAPGAVYTQNAGFDRTGKGYITRSDITSSISSVLSRAINEPRIAIPALTLGSVMIAFAISIGAIEGWQYYKARS